jgi:hypothetical protein
MAVTQVGSATIDLQSETTSQASFSHTVGSGTTLLIITVHITADESVTGTPTWNTNEDFTLIDVTTASASDLDTVTYVYGLVDPTATTANIVVNLTTSSEMLGVVAVNYSGTETASVAAATNFLSEDVNDSAAETNVSVHASAGNSGNALFMAATGKGADLSPASQTVGNTFTEICDEPTNGSATADVAIWVGHLLNNAPSAITLTWALTDSNASTYIEIVAAEEPPTSIIKSVERITIDWDAASEPVTQNLSKSQTYTKCVPFFTKRLVSGSLTDDWRERTMKVEMIDNAGTPAVRVSASGKSSANDHRIEVYVVEFETLITVQQIDGDITDTNSSANITIANVTSQSSAFFLYSYQYTHGSAQDRADYGCVRPIWNGASTTSVTIERTGTTGAIDGMLYVVSCSNSEFSVQHRDISVSATDELTNDTITAVPAHTSFLLTHFRSSEAEDDPLDWSFVADLSSTTNVRVRRSIAGASNAAGNVGVQVVTALGGQWAVQRGDFTTTSNLTETTVFSAVDLARSIVKTGTHEAGLNSLGTSDLTAGTIVDEVGPAAYLSANNTITWTRESVSETGNTIPWEVIQFLADLDNPILVPTGPLR